MQAKWIKTKAMQLTTHFRLEEFDCKDGSRVPDEYICNVQKVAAQLQILRDYLGEPIQILSAYRTPTHNKKVGGASKSQHLTASAADITVKSKTPKQLAAIIERLIDRGKLTFGGMGVYKNFVHVDIRKKKTRW
jgi:uncharacterized protein YcbK (DUF882 family)